MATPELERLASMLQRTWLDDSEALAYLPPLNFKKAEANHIARAILTELIAIAGEEKGMVEAVARAICQADEQNGGPPWEAQNKYSRSGYLDASRAAIPAMIRHVLGDATDRIGGET